MKSVFKQVWPIILTSLMLTFSVLGTVPAYAKAARAHSADVTPPTVVFFSAGKTYYINQYSNSLDIPITTFTASDNIGVTGYMITEFATAPGAADAGWSGAQPTTYTVGADGTYSLYPWAKDADGNVSAVFASPVIVIVDTTAPTVISSLRPTTSPSGAGSVDFTITFSEDILGLDAADFELTTSGTSGAFVTSTSASSWHATSTVSVNTGLGSGTIRVDVPDTATITDRAGNALTSLPFTSGEVYTFSRATWYVATTGNDSNSCAAVAAPCMTINAAIGKAAAGDAINVATGTYTGTGMEVVLVSKGITLSGGWDAGFTAQNGMSVIDGEAVRRGITTDVSPVVVEYFKIQHGFHSNQGGGIANRGTLTLNNSIVSGNVSHWMGGGIDSFGTLTTNNTSISGNSAGESCCGGGGGGGGIENYDGTATLNNSTVSGNTIIGSFEGSGIDTGGTLILNNSTVSGNTGGNGNGIDNDGILVLNNSTISNNQNYGVSNGWGRVSLKNTIIAGNGAIGDCYNSIGYDGIVTSQGYNLIGNGTSCSLTPTAGDQVGTSANRINALLGPLQDNGGLTFTHALLGGSPALNAGNPLPPGSDESACTATDQRGIARPVNGLCDIGAYEVDGLIVETIKRLNPNPTSASQVEFVVTFSKNVTGVDTIAPFNDFSLTSSGVKGAFISSVSGSGNTYTVTVNTGSGSGNGSIRLNVLDDDSILDASNNPLGGIGGGNGNCASGEVYTLLKVPTPILPTNSITDTTPTYTWNTIPSATHYQYQLVMGTRIIYTKLVAASACDASTCSNTPKNVLGIGSYKWKVRAKIGGVWKNSSAFTTFMVVPGKPGFWSGSGLDFYVTSKNNKVDNFAIYIRVTGCGSYKITNTRLVPIVNKDFAFIGSFYASGTFRSIASAQGNLGLKWYYVPGCGYLSGGPFTWTAKWKNASQASGVIDSTDENLVMTITPELDSPFAAPFAGPFTIDPSQP